MDAENTQGIGGFFARRVTDAPHGRTDVRRFVTQRQALIGLMSTLARKSGKQPRVELPAALCPDVVGSLHSLGSAIAMETFHIDEDFQRIGEAADGAYPYHCNLFGLSPLVAPRHPNTVVDNAHAFFEFPLPGVSTLYSPRKFLAVFDGGYLYTDEMVDEPETRWDASFPQYMVLAYRDAQDGLKAYRSHEASLADSDGRGMSAWSRALVQASILEEVAAARRENFRSLHTQLSSTNELSNLIDDRLAHSGFVPYHYPYLVDRGDLLRQHLHENQIWAPALWPLNTFSVELTAWERHLLSNTVHLPIDQRYKLREMERILEVVAAQGS